LDAPTKLDETPDDKPKNVVAMPKPKKRSIPAGTLSKVKSMVDKEDITVDHLLELRELIDEMIARKKEMV